MPTTRTLYGWLLWFMAERYVTTAHCAMRDHSPQKFRKVVGDRALHPPGQDFSSSVGLLMDFFAAS